jgi:hypothetical protein
MANPLEVYFEEWCVRKSIGRDLEK